ncbi:TrkA-C domain-containing protein [Haloplanus vescus]|uniref:TrkA-C domain-containing protein n=1 Tax=Haloplanus vescus TaxID=555874 RepID=A0A1H4AKA4_9EURY|nr:TrkA C-terminal domain-containing protein [Haloplanus vescus]SEA36198.1 TrkA-C domain-containing protein [Haloplanus vescus]
MASFPVEVLFGLYLGVLTGIVPALVAWGFGFAFKYITGVTIPALGVVVLSVAIAGVNGGLMALNDPTFTQSASQVRLSVAVIFVLMLSLYAHSVGDKMGAEFPRKLSLRKLTNRTLSADVVELVGGRGLVEVRISGDIDDMEGYPAVPADLRSEIREWSSTFPADVPLVELESRVADRLRTEFDLADVSVTLDERATATVAAAPPLGGLSKRIPSGKRGVSVRALLPTGTARGDEVSLATPDRRYRGTVVSLRSDHARDAAMRVADTDGGTDVAPDPTLSPSLPVADGGDGRLTVAVDASQASSLLGDTVDRLTVQSRGTRREYELLSLLRWAGNRIQKVAVREGAPLAGTTIGDAAVRDTHGVTVLAVRHEGNWQFAPRGSQALTAGDDLFVVGTNDAITSFRGAVA